MLFAKQLHALRPPINYRNIITHNAVSFVFFIEEDASPMREAIWRQDDDHVVGLHELKSVMLKVIIFRDGIYEASARIRLEKFDMERLTTKEVWPQQLQRRV